MKLEELQLEVRPRRPSQTMALVARTLQHRPGPILTAWGIAALPIAALGLGLLLGLDLHPGVAWGVTLVTASLFTPPLVVTVGHLLFSPQITFTQVVRATLPRVLPYAVLFIAGRLATLLAALLAVIPGLFFLRSTWFLGPIVLLEGAPMSASLRRGRRFALGYHGHVLAHAVHATFLLGYFTFTFAALLHVFNTMVFGQTFPQLAALAEHDAYVHAVGLIGLALAVPLVTMVWFFAYLDVRTRKEGWDLEIAFRARAAQMETGRG